MADTPINIFDEEGLFDYPNVSGLNTWVVSCASNEGFKPVAINLIFCSDERLLEINKEYLDHDFYTDIITFDQSETPNSLEGDLFISIERVEENSAKSNSAFIDELDRVIIHGLLHLMGYSDKTDEQVKEMREKEDACLILRHT